MAERPMRLEWKLLSRRFRQPLRTATGEYAVRDSLVVRVTDSSGRSGYGEVAPWPGFPVETVREAADFLKNLESAPEVVPENLPCVATAFAHARAWIREGYGAADVALPCAGLIRDVDDIATAGHALASGVSSFKVKIGVASVREEQRALSVLLHALSDIAPVKLRPDANGALNAAACEAWCEFLSEFPEVEWLEQPMRVGEESSMRAIGEKAGVADRLALDESVCCVSTSDRFWPGVLVVKPLLAGVTTRVAGSRGGARIAYSSVFESPFGRQAALCVAAAGSRSSSPAVGFDTLGAFDDTFEIHAPGPVARTVSRDAAFWDSLWERM